MGDTGGSNAGSRGKRAHSQQPIELVVEYTRLNSFFSDYTRNISKGGTFIKTPKPLDVGTEFMFKLRVPGMDKPLEILGRVHWVIRPDDAGTGLSRREPGMGIRFVFEDDTERDTLTQRVERLMVDSLGQLLYSRLMEQSARELEQSPGHPLAASNSSQATGGDGSR